MKKLEAWLLKKGKDERSAIRFLILGYFSLTILCLLFLLLPFAQKTSNSFIDHLFFAVSIVSTTGLAPTNFAESYNLFGQVISLIFIQLGGIGYMALSSFIVLKKYERIPTLSVKLLRLEFNLPQKYPLLQFIYGVFILTILIETIGVACLYIGFRDAGIAAPLWNAVFHSISAFCTAGFSLFSDSMISLKDYPWIWNTILVLSLLGSIGFIVLLDFWYRIIGRRKNITLTSKIILIGTFVISLLGSFLIFFSDTQLVGQGYGGMKTAMFQSISAHTTVGFNDYDISKLSVASIFIMIAIMIIGASPAGTGGGIKTTSITAIFAVLRSILKQKKRVTFLKKEIPSDNINLAISSLMFYVLVHTFCVWLILLIEGDTFNVEAILFEAASALSTVGISTGITGDFSWYSKLIISVLMFIGRLGVLTFGFVLLTKSPPERMTPKSEDIAI